MASDCFIVKRMIILFQNFCPFRGTAVRTALRRKLQRHRYGRHAGANALGVDQSRRSDSLRQRSAKKVQNVPPNGKKIEILAEKLGILLDWKKIERVDSLLVFFLSVSLGIYRLSQNRYLMLVFLLHSAWIIFRRCCHLYRRWARPIRVRY